MLKRAIATLVAAAGLCAATASAAATDGSGVRVAKDGVGTYIGNHFNSSPAYVVDVLAASPSLLEISMHAWTTCYPWYEMLNGHPVKLSPAQQKSFAASHGWGVPIPNVQLNPTGTFHKREVIRGSYGSSPTISGQVDGGTVSGTFSATDVDGGGSYHCNDVSFSWSATFDPTSQPDPSIFGFCSRELCYKPSSASDA